MSGHCSVIKLKPNSKHLVDAWAEAIAKYKDDAVETLRNEGATIESWFITTIDTSDYLIAYTRCDDLQKAHSTAKASAEPIDIIHKTFKKEAWAEHIKVTPLVDLQTL